MRKPFKTTRDAFRHRVNISESMDIVPRAAFTIVLFYFPDAGRTIWIVSDREPSTTVNINGAHKPWRIHLRMSRDELFFFFVAGCTSRLFPVFYFEFRATETNDFPREHKLLYTTISRIVRYNYKKNEIVEFQLTFLGQMRAAHFCIAIWKRNGRNR